jgi:hypothetical protein
MGNRSGTESWVQESRKVTRQAKEGITTMKALMLGLPLLVVWGVAMYLLVGGIGWLVRWLSEKRSEWEYNTKLRKAERDKKLRDILNENLTP